MSENTKTTPTLKDLRARRDEILAIAEKHCASNVRVFGSVARGDVTAQDVDFLVTFREGASIFDQVGLWLDLQDLLGCEVDLITDDDHPRRERFMRRVWKDAVPL